MVKDHVAVVKGLKAIVGEGYVIHEPEDLLVFEYDGSVDRGLPVVVVLPASTDEVSKVVKLAVRYGLPVVPRGAGTGLSGGSVPAHGGIVIALTRMTRIHEIDPWNMLAVVDPGVLNLTVSQAASKYGLCFAPDPSSQRACTIGGNVAENSGGPHCLAYGVMTNHVLGMEVVLADGSVQWLGGRTRETSGYDLRGAVIGSEGMLAIVTKVIVRLQKQPEEVKTLLAVYRTLEDAGSTVSEIIAAGMLPATVEMMDHICIRAAEAAIHAGFPEDAGAVLLVEIEGLKEAVIEESAEVEAICRKRNPIVIRTAADAVERERLWAGRKGVLGALGWLAPNYLLLDGTVPRTRLLEVLVKIRDLSEKSGFPIAALLHAGDGNLHPTILFDERKPGETQKVLEVGGEILKICLAAGGALSGEHGIGIEKKAYMPLMFSNDDLTAMARLPVAFGSENVFNPGKVFPDGFTLVSQAERPAPSH